MKGPLSDNTNNPAKKAKKNKETNRKDCSTWPESVWNGFSSKIELNQNSKGASYYTVQPVPLALVKSPCHYPTGSNQIMISTLNQQFQRPLHRLMIQLDRRSKNLPVLTKIQQASHLCMDGINEDGKGSKNCVNVNHIVVATRQTSLDNAAQDGSGFNPLMITLETTCTHSPPCPRYQTKATIPTYCCLK